jgi:SAM-dependent methyltransferase
MPNPSLDAVAPFYDLDLEGYDDDLDLYVALAAEFGGPVLELGCGTGRVALAVARAGHEVVAVDNSASMLAVARAQPGAERVRWHEDDMRHVALGQAFPLILVPLGGLQHLETSDDLVLTFANIAAHLAPGGSAVIDVEAPGAEDFEPGPHPVVEHWTRPWGAGQVTKWVSVTAFPSAGLREVTWHFDVQEDGPLQRYTSQFLLRTFTAPELELVGRLAGLTAVAAHGDYAGSPYDDAAERLVMTFEHAASEDAR